MQSAGLGFNLLIVSSEANYRTICPDFWLHLRLVDTFQGPLLLSRVGGVKLPFC